LPFHSPWFKIQRTRIIKGKDISPIHLRVENTDTQRESVENKEKETDGDMTATRNRKMVKDIGRKDEQFPDKRTDRLWG
jgi:hypothetical protein